MEVNYFKWGPELETGSDEIDQQHHVLIDIINEIISICLESEQIDLSAVKSISEKLNNYTIFHFTNEEQMMEFYNVDTRHREAHIAAHIEFTNEIFKFFSDINSINSISKIGEFFEYLIQWLSLHIMNVDKSLIRQIEFIKNENLLAKDAYEIDQKIFNESAAPFLKALKALFELVSEKNKRLTQINNELEEKVKLRTIELQRAIDKIEYIAMRDELTGLYNRRFAIIQIESAINEWKRYHTVFSILFIDLDTFKQVNDKHGHEVGDKVLQWVANLLRINTRRTDIVCRLGGDEFLVICNHCSRNDGLKLSNKLIAKCKDATSDEIFQFWTPSLSIGVYEIEEGYQTVSEIIKMADGLMYDAKVSGGNRVN